MGSVCIKGVHCDRGNSLGQRVDSGAGHQQGAGFSRIKIHDKPLLLVLLKERLFQKTLSGVVYTDQQNPAAGILQAVDIAP